MSSLLQIQSTWVNFWESGLVEVNDIPEDETVSYFNDKNKSISNPRIEKVDQLPSNGIYNTRSCQPQGHKPIVQHEEV